jgi:hypothetical protein
MESHADSTVMTEPIPTPIRCGSNPVPLNIGEILLGVKPERLFLWAYCGWTFDYQAAPERSALRIPSGDLATANKNGTGYLVLFLVVLTALLLIPVRTSLNQP